MRVAHAQPRERLCRVRGIHEQLHEPRHDRRIPRWCAPPARTGAGRPFSGVRGGTDRPCCVGSTCSKRPRPRRLWPRRQRAPGRSHGSAWWRATDTGWRRRYAGGRRRRGRSGCNRRAAVQQRRAGIFADRGSCARRGAHPRTRPHVAADRSSTRAPNPAAACTPRRPGAADTHTAGRASGGFHIPAAGDVRSAADRHAAPPGDVGAGRHAAGGAYARGQSSDAGGAGNPTATAHLRCRESGRRPG